MAGYEVGSAYLTVMPSAKGFAASLGREIDGPFSSAGQRGGGLLSDGVHKGGKGPFASIGKQLGGMFAGYFTAQAASNIISGIVGFFGDAISAAANLAETQSKVEQIFGDSTAAVQSFAGDSKKNLLLTEQQALDAAGTFGIFGKSAGLTGKPLSDFSTDMVGLASDLASFSNTTPEQAIEAIGSALRGESEPIRNYGVLLDDATLKARAMEMGIYDGTDALTPQQRVLAAHAEILAQTSTQQGDAARTADSFSNQQRILTKNIEDTKVEIGEALLPVMSDMLSLFLDEGVPALQDMATWFTENKDEIGDFVLATVDGSLLVVQALLDMAAGASGMLGMWLDVGSLLVESWMATVGAILDGAVRGFGWVPGLGDKLRGAQEDFAIFRDDVSTKLEDARNSADTMTEAFQSGRDMVGDLREAVQNLDGKSARVTLQMDAQGNATRFFTDGTFSRGGGALTGRATGGPVVAGRPYIVGEREAELFVPSTSGTILNQSQIASALGGSGGSGVTQNIYPGPGMSERQIGDAAADRLARALTGRPS